MNKKLFKELIEFVKGIPEENFSMLHVLSKVESSPNIDLQNHHCNTTGCVAGHFPFIFPEHFQYVKLDSGWDVQGKEANIWESIAWFLDIRYRDVISLFVVSGVNDLPLFSGYPSARYRSKSQQLEVMELFYEQTAF